jgi:WD40 repeat protein
MMVTMAANVRRRRRETVVKAVSSMDEDGDEEDPSFEVMTLDSPPPSPPADRSQSLSPPATPNTVPPPATPPTKEKPKYCEEKPSPDSPISRFRREKPQANQFSTASFSKTFQQPDDDCSSLDTSSTLDWKIAAEIAAAQRVAQTAALSDVSVTDARVHRLVLKSLEVPRIQPRWSSNDSKTTRELHKILQRETQNLPKLVDPDLQFRRMRGLDESVQAGQSLFDDTDGLADVESSEDVNTDTVNAEPKRSLGAIDESHDGGDEKKEECSDTEQDEIALRARTPEVGVPKESITGIAEKPQTLQELQRSLSMISMTESDVGSVDGLPVNLQSSWTQSSSRKIMLQNLDGVPAIPERPRREGREASSSLPSTVSTQGRTISKAPSLSKIPEEDLFSEDPTFMDALSFFCGGACEPLVDDFEEEEIGATGTSPAAGIKKPSHHRQRSLGWGNNEDDAFALLPCANIIHRHRWEEQASNVPTSLVRVTGEPPVQLPYPQTLKDVPVDPRLQPWVRNQFSHPADKPSKDGSYHLGSSRTVIVHEIVRGNWTWCTAWSPDGNLLAVATENHRLAVIDISSSVCWRVLHDQKITGPARGDTTHSIRSIAWGSRFIAIGGTGNAVSILSAVEPYPVLHVITKTGFVGSLDWKNNSTDLAIASRAGKAMIVRITAKGADSDSNVEIESTVLQTIERSAKIWVNCVKFSPRGMCLAVADSGGHLLIYNYGEEKNGSVELSLMKTFKLEDSILAIDWSADGKWVYAGGEDFHVTVIETRYWEIVHRVKRDRWVQCISSSRGGSHVAAGGVSSEISLFDVDSGWDNVMGVDLNGLVPLSAQWHPKDQYLSLTGQHNSIMVVETTNARHVKGHHLLSICPILAIEFSPDGRTAIVGNENGLVTFFSLSGSTFVTSYELVVTLNAKLSIRWSLNGLFVAIGSKDSLIIVCRREKQKQHRKNLPPNASGFMVRKIVRNLHDINCVSIDTRSRYLAISGARGTWIMKATSEFSLVREFSSRDPVYSSAWSPDGRWLATVGAGKVLTIYDTSDDRVDRWRPVFSIACSHVGRAMAWSPIVYSGLLYLAFGGDGKSITIMEIRTQEGTWETVLRIPRPGAITHLDWNKDGLLAAAIANGTVSIVDLGYLFQSFAVNEMDYNWQRQALTCFAEIRRNRGKNVMSAVRWIPSAPGSDSLIAVGGTDGEVEIVDLTERQRCRGYVRR